MATTPTAGAQPDTLLQAQAVWHRLEAACQRQPLNDFEQILRFTLLLLGGVCIDSLLLSCNSLVKDKVRAKFGSV